MIGALIPGSKGADGAAGASIGGGGGFLTSVAGPWDAARRYFLLSMVTAGTTTTTTPVIDSIKAFPFMLGRRVTLDRLAFQVTSGNAAALARIGIYAADVDTGAPTDLLVDGGQFAGTAGVKSAVVALTLEAGTLYWGAYLCGVVAIGVRACSQGSLWTGPFGFSEADFASFGTAIDAAQAYGAFPAAFPGGIALAAVGAVPGVFARFTP